MKIKLRICVATSVPSCGKGVPPARFIQMIQGTYDSGPMAGRAGTVLVQAAHRNEEARWDGLERIRCGICDSALCVMGVVGGREEGGAPPGTSEVQLENDGGSHSFRCPYCSARNVTIVTTSGAGRPALQVAWAVMSSD